MSVKFRTGRNGGKLGPRAVEPYRDEPPRRPPLDSRSRCGECSHIRRQTPPPLYLYTCSSRGAGARGLDCTTPLTGGAVGSGTGPERTLPRAPGPRGGGTGGAARRGDAALESEEERGRTSEPPASWACVWGFATSDRMAPRIRRRSWERSGGTAGRCHSPLVASPGTKQG